LRNELRKSWECFQGGIEESEPHVVAATCL
jgi:hypothetical protein